MERNPVMLTKDLGAPPWINIQPRPAMEPQACLFLESKRQFELVIIRLSQHTMVARKYSCERAARRFGLYQVKSRFRDPLAAFISA